MTNKEFSLFDILKKYPNINNATLKELYNYLINLFKNKLYNREESIKSLELFNPSDMEGFLNEFIEKHIFSKINIIFEKNNDESMLYNYLFVSFNNYCIQSKRNSESHKIINKIKNILESNCTYSSEKITNRTQFHCNFPYIEEEPVLKRRGKTQSYSKETLFSFISYYSSIYNKKFITIKEIFEYLNNKYSIKIHFVDIDSISPNSLTAKTSIDVEVNYYNELFMNFLSKEEIELLRLFLENQGSYTKLAMEKFGWSMGTTKNRINAVTKKIKDFSTNYELNQNIILEILKKICVIDK